ncbi:MAG: peptidyl-prolyl cis-trans isomerase [Armatimonadetes bacterium]|nr:peptidyl-prolyl cis-trans isomerase [Armatimonadota bacterium]
MRRNVLLAIGAVAVAAVTLSFVGCGKSGVNLPDPVATVNGAPVSSTDFINQSTLQAGNQALQTLIEKQILLQWAEEEKVAVTDVQVNKQIEILKRDGMYDDQIKLLGEDGLKSELKAMQARINLFEKLEKITDPEIKTAYDLMKPRYVHGQRKWVALILNSDKKKVEEAAAKIKGGMDFDKAALLYSDPRFPMRGAAFKIWVEETQKGLPAPIAKAAKDTKMGEVSSIVTVVTPPQPNQPTQPTLYCILKFIQEQPKANSTLDQVKDEVKDTVAMQNAQMDPDFQKKFDEQKKKANIDIKIDRLGDLVGTFKNPPPPNPYSNMMRGPGGP